MGKKGTTSKGETITIHLDPTTRPDGGVMLRFEGVAGSYLVMDRDEAVAFATAVLNCVTHGQSVDAKAELRVRAV